MLEQKNIGIIGLGYVGLPLAIEFGKKYKVLGFDINQERIKELKKGNDHTFEADITSLNEAITLFKTSGGKQGLTFSSNEKELIECNIYIVTVPTPIDKFNVPDLRPLITASETIGRVISRGNIVIYESTTYPGCTEEDCAPIIERISGLIFNKDFFVGYSPERINPGDKINTLTKIKKVTSGSTPEVANYVDALYSSIITAGTYKASCIKVAEASKIIENTQRDINVSFMNELALIFDRMGIDTNEVIDVAGTKWNFLKYRPGLVGGHCISVDPYYLANKAESLGYVPQVILSGRRVNNSIAPFIAHKVLKLMIQKGTLNKDAKVLILGVTFKENCPDIRNTKVIDIYKELKEFDVHVDIYDPWVDEKELKRLYGIQTIKEVKKHNYEGVIVAVAHSEFIKMNVQDFITPNGIIFDVKGILPRNIVSGRL